VCTAISPPVLALDLIILDRNISIDERLQSFEALPCAERKALSAAYVNSLAKGKETSRLHRACPALKDTIHAGSYVVDVEASVSRDIFFIRGKNFHSTCNISALDSPNV
jgi:hypothetical protein